MFNDKYRLTQAVLEGRKTQTRRIAYNGEVPNLIKGYGYEGHICGSAAIFNGEYMIAKSRYNVYDVVAVAQSYQDVLGITHVEDLQLRDALIRSKGYTNKMFVRADLMPNRIRITDIRAERLQEISDEDCIAEGIREQYFYSGEEEPEFEGYSYYAKNVLKPLFCTPRETYAALIDKISGKGTWVSNPYVFVYEFELIK